MTSVPAQIVSVVLKVIETDGVTTGLTSIVIVLLPAVAGIVQALLPVSRQRTESPFVGRYVYEMPVATGMPFLIH